MHDPISQRAAILVLTPLERSRDANKFHFQFVTAGAYYGEIIRDDELIAIPSVERGFRIRALVWVLIDASN